MFRIHHVTYLFLLAPILGCSSSNTTSNAGASCSSTAPCGGTLEGTWRINSVCVEGDLASAMNAQMGLPAACDNTFQSATLSGAGTVTFANSAETDNLTQSIDANLVFTAACESAVAKQTVTLTASTRSTIQQTLTASGGFTTANCSLSNGSCMCTASREQQAPTAPQPYTVSGNTITYSGTDASSPTDYCVSGTLLTARQPLSGISGVTVVSVLQKQ